MEMSPAVRKEYMKVLDELFATEDLPNGVSRRPIGEGS